jgi:hypothetical protein
MLSVFLKRGSRPFFRLWWLVFFCVNENKRDVNNQQMRKNYFKGIDLLRIGMCLRNHLPVFKKQAILFWAIFFVYQTSQAQFSCAGFSSTNINYTGGIQTFTVPAGVSQVRISLTGASGGLASAATNLAGGGATVYAYINVVPGDVFRIIIGQKGANGINEAGGGGSSAVYKNGVLIMVAGGGGGEDNTGDGGGGLASENGGDGGSDASSNSSDGCGTSPNNGKGGIAGNGGNHGEFAANCPHGGGGGGGLNSAGQGNGNMNAGQPGGQGSSNGAAGGLGSLDDAIGINGGWGWSGGGGADDRESGGGGGYSGGGGGPESRNPAGGGSFVAAIGTNGITASGKTDGTGTTTGFNGSGIVCSPVQITLPVVFETFTAARISSGIQLTWLISSETGTSYYDVERSNDGERFTSIGTVNASGTKVGNRQYSFIDKAVNMSQAFYRLKIVDVDTRITYSTIRYVGIGQEKLNLSVYPNPANERITVILPANWKNEEKRIVFINATGQVVVDKTVTDLQNDFNVSRLPSGVYLVKAVTGTGKQLTLKFIK